jgi:dihydroflavonol-4-reductase
MSDSNGKSSPVCVTGASGFIGTHVVRELLARGYRVRGTVRDAANEDKTAHLRQLPGAGERLELRDADLLEPGSFDDVIAGCEHVYHVASPVFLTAKDPQREIVEPAVQGTQNVLASIEKAGTVRQVGVTSSIAAVASTRPRAGHVYTEDDWNEDATLKSSPYALGKTLAEKAVWDWREGLDPENRPGLCVVNPVMVFGPVYTRGHMRSSPSVIRDVLVGTFKGCPPIGFNIVDVRDVADALVSGVESPQVDGRFILQHKGLWLKQIAEIVAPKYPEMKVPTRWLPGAVLYVAALWDKRLSFSRVRNTIGRLDAISNERVRSEIGTRFRSVEQSVLDTAESMFERGLIERRR